MLGGNRSGKSAFAETLVGTQADYLATAELSRDDAEWAARIAAHRARRPAGWRTIETAEVAGELAIDGPPLLVDSITAWLARVMTDCGCWTAAEQPGALAARIEQLGTAWAGTAREAVAVSDEIGLGVVPETPAGRRFRDELGALNQRLAAAADAVYLVVAGLTLQLK